MNRKYNTLQMILSATAMILLILDTKTALSGASEGISMCMKTVIPSLFPFFVLSNILTSGLIGHNSPFGALIGKLFGIPRGCESILIVGFLGGYPLGAQSAAHAYRAKVIRKKDCARLLKFCSNAGPSFIFGLAGALFDSPAIGWILWAIQILSALFVSFMFPSSKSKIKGKLDPSGKIDPVQALQSALRTIVSVCGWIVLFRVIIAFFERWFLWILPLPLQIIFCGILELSNGCIALQHLESKMLRFIICAGLLGFGGICVTMQTASVVGDLGIRDYLTGKCIQAIFSVLIAWTAAPFLFPESVENSSSLWIFLILVSLILASRNFKNNSRNPLPSDV